MVSARTGVTQTSALAQPSAAKVLIKTRSTLCGKRHRQRTSFSRSESDARSFNSRAAGSRLTRACLPRSTGTRLTILSMSGFWGISAVLATFWIIEVCRCITTANLPIDQDADSEESPTVFCPVWMVGIQLCITTVTSTILTMYLNCLCAASMSKGLCDKAQLFCPENHC